MDICKYKSTIRRIQVSIFSYYWEPKILWQDGRKLKSLPKLLPKDRNNVLTKCPRTELLAKENLSRGHRANVATRTTDTKEHAQGPWAMDNGQLYPSQRAIDHHGQWTMGNCTHHKGQLIPMGHGLLHPDGPRNEEPVTPTGHGQLHVEEPRSQEPGTPMGHGQLYSKEQRNEE